MTREKYENDVKLVELDNLKKETKNLKTENEKLNYRINILLRTLEYEEKKNKN